MHDFHEANKILKLVLAHAKKNKLKKVTKIVIKLGKIMEHGEVINPGNLKFNIKLLAENSVAAGAKILVEEVRGDSWELESIEGES